MNRSHRFLAAATGTVLAIGLVSVPPHAPAAPVRVEAYAVQLQAIAATEAAALLNTDGVQGAVSVATGTPADSAAETITTDAEAPTIAGALIDVVTSFVFMTLMAPISIAMSPLLLMVQGLAGSANCRSLACLLVAPVVALPVAGPAVLFAGSLQRLWSTVFPPAPATGSAPTVDTPESPDAVVPQPGSAAKVTNANATATATATSVAASRSASATTLDPLVALVDVGTSLLRAIAWIPIAAIFAPLWVATGFPGPASGLQPWEPGSDCPGSGAAFGCFLRSVAYGLVAYPYYEFAQSVQNFAETILPPRAALPAATVAPVAPVASRVVQATGGPQEAVRAPSETPGHLKRREDRRSDARVTPASAIAAEGETTAAEAGRGGSEKSSAARENRGRR